MGIGKETRKLLLYRLIRLVKALYPTTRTNNPYQSQLSTYLELEDQLLCKDLIHVLTILNGHSRLTDKELTSTQTDYLNALQMILPRELQLTPKVLAIHEQLLGIYEESPFTYIESCSRLKTSKTVLKRILRPLLLHGLAEKCKPDKGTKILIRVLKSSTKHETSMFDQAHEAWKDYKGFVEL